MSKSSLAVPDVPLPDAWTAEVSTPCFATTKNLLTRSTAVVVWVVANDIEHAGGATVNSAQGEIQSVVVHLQGEFGGQTRT